MKKKIEILAPAKDLLTGIAAINAGADAVYIGAPQFGARSNANNSLEDVAALVGYAHLFKVQVFVVHQYNKQYKRQNQLVEIEIDLERNNFYKME